VNTNFIKIAFLPLIILLSAILSFSGCVSYTRGYDGLPIKSNPNNIITVGLTDKKAVLNEFGPPWRIFKSDNGDIFYFQYNLKKRVSIVIGDPIILNFEIFRYTWKRKQTNALSILFDTKDKVLGFSLKKEID
jgi:hypothetical protein